MKRILIVSLYWGVLIFEGGFFKIELLDWIGYEAKGNSSATIV
jgi:hypothetical protein